jgi:hypothetical protein
MVAGKAGTIAMTEETLRHRVERHNSVQLLTAIVLFSGAAVFWWLSFWIFRGLMCSGRRSRTATN